jgi:Phosphate-selective porin O and P
MSIREHFLPPVPTPSGGHASSFQRRLSGINAQRAGRTTSALLIASLMLGVSSAAVLAGDDGSSMPTADQATNKALLKKLEAMEKRMLTLEDQLKQKQGQPQTPRTAQSLVNGRPPVAGMPIGPYAQASAAEADSAAKKNDKKNDLFSTMQAPVPGLKIGMYGEIKYGTQQNPAANGQWQNGFDMARLVLLPTYQVTDNITFNAEIEFEHAGAGFDNDDKLHGTAEIEQAFFDFRFNDYFTLRSPGVDLVPISFNNLYHEPTLFYSVERPELANGLIPSTWVAPSAGFYGKIVDGLNYQFQISQSAEDFGDDFDHRGANGAPIPGGYAPGVDGANALGFAHAPLGGFTQMSNVAAYTARLSYQPAFMPGFAGSTAVYYSPNITPRGAYGDDLRLLGSNAMTIIDTEARYRMPNTGLELRAEYAYVNFSNPENLRANNDSLTNLDSGTSNNVGKDMYGYSGEIAYHVKMGTILGSEWEAVPFYRYTRQNLQTGGVFGIDPNGSTGSGDMTFHDVGIAVFPNPSLVLKLNYTKIQDHSVTGPMADRVLGGVGWLW